MLYFIPIYNQSLKWKIAALISWLFILSWCCLCVCLDAGRSSSQHICVFSGISTRNFCRMEKFSQRGCARVNENMCVNLTRSHGSSKLSSAIYRHTLSPILSFSLSPIINLALSLNSLHGLRACMLPTLYFSMHVCIRNPPCCRFVGHAWAVCLCSQKSISHVWGWCPETETGRETTSKGKSGGAKKQRSVM